MSPVDEYPSSAPPRRLRRSRQDRVVAGVAGGLGDHLGVDPVLIRLAFVVLALAGGSGVLLYVIAWIVVPEADPGASPSPAAPSARGSVIAGLGLMGIGVVLLLDRLVPALSWSTVGPVVLVALGILVLVRGGGAR